MKFLLLSFLLISCTKISSIATVPASSATPKQQTPISSRDCVNREWCRVYDELIVSKLTPRLIAYGPEEEFCPNWENLDKEYFWKNFIKAIAKTESNWNNLEEYPEKFDDDGCGFSTGKSISTGLMQLSYGDRCVYPTTTCKKLTKQNLKDWSVNLPCALEIMDMLIAKRKPLSLYWSSLDLEATGDETIQNMREFIPDCF